MSPKIVLITSAAPGIVNYTRKMAGIFSRLTPEVSAIFSHSIFALQLTRTPGHLPVYQLSNADRWMLVLIWLDRNPLSIVMHDLQPRTAWIRPVMERIYAALFRKANIRHILVHSEGARRKLLETWGDALREKVSLINFPLFGNQDVQHTEHLRPGLHIRHFVMPGAITPQKGAHIVAAAFAQSTLSSLGAKLHIAGSFSSRDYYEQVVRAAAGCPAIHIENRNFTNQEFDDLFLNADFILTHKLYSKGESSGIVSNAIFFNRPVLISDADLSSELLELPAFVVPAGDASALAARLEQICTDAELVARMHQKIATLQECLQPSALAVQYAEIFGLAAI